MKSQYKRDISKDYFRPLKNFHYNLSFHPSVADNKQLVLAKNLYRSYGIAEGNILRLIMYADIALSYATESEIQLYYSDLKEIADFEENSENISKIAFRGKTRSFEITNPYLVDGLYKSLLNLIDFQKIMKSKQSAKKRTSGTIIKKVATELYIELTDKEKITGSKPLYIIGYIFSLYNVGLKRGEPILSEQDFKLRKKLKQEDGLYITESSYLQYLSGRIKGYINWKDIKTNPPDNFQSD